MLTNEIQPGVLLFGLGQLIGSGRPGFNARYRVVRIGTQKAIEFFDGVPGKPGELPVKILPYRQGEIAAVTVGDVDSNITSSTARHTPFTGQAQVPGENRTVFGPKTETRYRVLPDMGI